MLDPRDNPPASLLERFRDACATKSDINEHLGTLYGLARQCEYVAEFGVRFGVSTVALLAAQPASLVCYDIGPCPVIETLQTMRGRTRLTFFQKDSRDVGDFVTDLLHIDTIHAYSCLSVELRLHAPKVRRFIAMHDTWTFGTIGDDGGAGMGKAIDELITGGKWRMLMNFPHCNGMTVLQRIAPE